MNQEITPELVQQLLQAPNVTDQQLIELANMFFAQWPQEKRMAFIQGFKAKGLNNKQIIEYVLHAVQQSMKSSQLMPNLRQQLKQY